MPTWAIITLAVIAYFIVALIIYRGCIIYARVYSKKNYGISGSIFWHEEMFVFIPVFWPISLLIIFVLYSITGFYSLILEKGVDSFLDCWGKIENKIYEHFMEPKTPKKEKELNFLRR